MNTVYMYVPRVCVALVTLLQKLRACLPEKIITRLTSKHLVFPQPAAALCALSHGSVLWGSFTSVWWLQKVWKPSGPSRREGRRPPEGGAHLGHVFRGQVQYRTAECSLWKGGYRYPVRHEPSGLQISTADIQGARLREMTEKGSGSGPGLMSSARISIVVHVHTFLRKNFAMPNVSACLPRSPFRLS